MSYMDTGAAAAAAAASTDGDGDSCCGGASCLLLLLSETEPEAGMTEAVRVVEEENQEPWQEKPGTESILIY